MDNVVELRAGSRNFEYHHLRVGAQRVRAAIRPAQHGVAPPLLFCNGIGANIELAAPFFDCLNGVGVVAFDAPGTGGSPRPAHPLSIVDLAWLCAALLDAFEIGQADVLGFSWGGAMAQEFARLHPQRCRRLVLASTSPGATMVPGRLAALQAVLDPHRFLRPDRLSELAGVLYGPDAEGGHRLAARHVEALIPPDPIGYAWQLWAGCTWTSLPWLWTLQQPTLILHGADDEVVPPANAWLLGTCIRRARVRILPGGHLCLFTRAQDAARTVRDFLNATG